MIRRLIFSLVLLSACAFGTTFTATQNGEWNVGTTWGHTTNNICGTDIPCITSTFSGGVPTNGDKAIIPTGITVTCGSSSAQICSFGTSTNTATTVVTSCDLTMTGASPGLHIYNGSTFVLGGCGSMAGGTLTVDDNTLVVMDQSWYATPTTVNIYFSTYTTSAAFGTVSINSQNDTVTPTVFDGDAFDSPKKQGGVCTSLGSCRGGVWGAGPAASFQNDAFTGTCGGLTVKNTEGLTSGSDHVALFMGTAKGNVTCNNLTVTNSGLTKVTQISTFNSSFNELTIGNSTNPNLGGSGCFFFNYGAPAPTGKHTLTNSVLHCNVKEGGQVSGDTTITMRNVFFDSDGLGTETNIFGGFLVVAEGTHDQIFMYNNTWENGASENTSDQWVQPNQNLTNSVIWAEKNSINNVHVHRWKSNYSGTTNGALIQYSVFGAMNVDCCRGFIAGGSVLPPPNADTKISWLNNISLPGANGYGSVMTPFMSGPVTTNNQMDYTVEQNTIVNGLDSTEFNTAKGSTSFNTPSVIMGEAVTGTGTLPTMSTTFDSNHFFNTGTSASTPAQSGVYIGELCVGFNTVALANFWNGSFLFVDYNSVSNTALSAANEAICVQNRDMPAGSAVPAHDTIQQNHIPGHVDNYRSVPFFDYYALGAGLVTGSSTTPGTYWPAQANWQGAWQTPFNGHGDGTYHIGDIVSHANSGTPVNEFNGQTSYWYAVANCTPVAGEAAGGNEPIVGVDTGNVYHGHEACWEEAYLRWFRTTVLAGTTFDDQCRALGAACQVNLSSNHVGLVGLLNAWIRNGYISMEPPLWTAGKNGIEPSAVPIAPITRIAAVN